MQINKLNEAELAFYQESADLAGLTLEEYLQAGI
jgi:hypothetical protein